MIKILRNLDWIYNNIYIVNYKYKMIKFLHGFVFIPSYLWTFDEAY